MWLVFCVSHRRMYYLLKVNLPRFLELLCNYVAEITYECQTRLPFSKASKQTAVSDSPNHHSSYNVQKVTSGDANISLPSRAALHMQDNWLPYSSNWKAGASTIVCLFAISVKSESQNKPIAHKYRKMWCILSVFFVFYTQKTPPFSSISILSSSQAD